MGRGGGVRFRGGIMALSFAVGFLVGDSVTAAWAGHETDTPCTDTDPNSYRGAGIGEYSVSTWPADVLDRDGVRATMHVYDPRDQGYVDLVVHSIYIYESDRNFVETGWSQDKQAFSPPSIVAVVFAGKMVDANWIESGRHPTPFLDTGTDHTLKILRDPDGGAPKRYEFTIDSDQWGYMTQANMTDGGAVVAGTENFDSCEDFRTHAWALDKRMSPGGAWSNWGSLSAVVQEHTKWWRNEGATPPEWWIKHCPNDPWCPDDL